MNKGPFGSPGLVDFLLGKELLMLTCPIGKGLASHPPIKSLFKRSRQKRPRQAKCLSCVPKGQAGIQVFLDTYIFVFSS